MRTVGPSETTFLVNGAGPGTLRAGVVVSVAVRERLGAELYRVAVGGLSLTAKARAGLEVGSVFRAAVERSGSTLLLRTLPEKGGGEAAVRSIEGLLARAGLPNDGASHIAAAVLLREGIALDPRSIGRVRRAVLREGPEASSEDEPGGSSSLAARMEAKGIGAEDAAVEAIVSQTRSGGQGRGGGRHHDERPEVLNADQPPISPGDLERGFVAEIDGADLSPVLGSFLRALAMRSGGEGSLLNLFNHLKGPDGSWVYVPFRFDLDSVAFTGSFHVKLPYVAGGPGRIEASFSASRSADNPGAGWSVGLSFGGGHPPSLRLAPGSPEAAATAQRLLPGLERELAALGCRVALVGRNEMVERGPAGELDLDA